MMIVSHLSLFSFHVEAKARCKPLLLKQHNIQSLQRKGYSLKQGQSLTRKENRARAKWWKCEQGTLSTRKLKKRPKKNNKSSNIQSRSYNKNADLINVKLTPINQHSAIVIKAKYQGDKRAAWRKFYQQPTQCQQPKTLKTFAYCTENKLQQQALFEQDYGR
jgi:hypothetical protein